MSCCFKFKLNKRVPKEDLEYFGRCCTVCQNHNGFYCTATGRGRDRDEKTYVDLSDHSHNWEDEENN